MMKIFSKVLKVTEFHYVINWLFLTKMKIKFIPVKRFTSEKAPTSIQIKRKEENEFNHKGGKILERTKVENKRRKLKRISTYKLITIRGRMLGLKL